MRRVLTLAGLLVVIFLAASMGTTTPAQAWTMCTTTCSASTLSCVPSGSCTSVPGSSITCDGVTTTCSQSNSWCACSNQCDINYDNCSSGCEFHCGICDRVYNRCITNCGAPPPNLSGC